LPIAVKAEVSVVRATERIPGRSISKRSISSAAKCWLSAALPPFPKPEDAASRPHAGDHGTSDPLDKQDLGEQILDGRQVILDVSVDPAQAGFPEVGGGFSRWPEAGLPPCGLVRLRTSNGNKM
jgi:hypothetical protein